MARFSLSLCKDTTIIVNTKIFCNFNASAKPRPTEKGAKSGGEARQRAEGKPSKERRGSLAKSGVEARQRAEGKPSKERRGSLAKSRGEARQRAEERKGGKSGRKKQGAKKKGRKGQTGKERRA